MEGIMVAAIMHTVIVVMEAQGLEVVTNRKSNLHQRILLLVSYLINFVWNQPSPATFVNYVL